MTARHLGILTFAVLLGGCAPDKVRHVAACEVESIRIYPQQTRGFLGTPDSRYMIACMAAKGYQITILAPGCDRDQAFGYQPACYTPTRWWAATMDKWSRPKAK